MSSHDRPLRILQVITDTDRRGAQVFATELGVGLTDLHQMVNTVGLAPGQRTGTLSVTTLGRRPRGLRTLLRLRREMRAVDVTIAHGSSTLLACALAGAGRRRPFVYRQISDSKFWANSWQRRWRTAGYLRRPRHVVALSAAAADTLVSFLRVPRSRVTVIPNGVLADSYSPASPSQRDQARDKLRLPRGVPLAVYCGVLAREKGIDLAIEALRDADTVHLAIIGDGPESEELRRVAARVAPSRVHFVGELSDMAVAYAAADMVVLSTRGGDSMPAVLIEAGLCGLPAISCPVGSIEEIVLDQETGVIVPPNDVFHLAAAMSQLANDRALRERLGRAAIAHCSTRFTISVVADQWLQVLRASSSKQRNVTHR